jgi:UDP-N-acetylmuramyl tripeptide synthase
MMGIFNIYNLIAAIAAVHITTNEKLENICKVVEGFAGSISGRMEDCFNKTSYNCRFCPYSRWYG